MSRPSARKPMPTARTRFFSGGTWHDAPVFDRDALLPGQTVQGPAMIIEPITARWSSRTNGPPR